MTTENPVENPCPTCKGFCCRIDGFPVSHGNEWRITPRSHICLDCTKGEAPSPSPKTPDGIAEAVASAIAAVLAQAVAEERAAVVAWLNAEADIVDCGHIEDLADRIERGEHRREEKTP